MITINFFDDNSSQLMKAFCSYFRLDEEEVIDYFITVNPDILSPESIIRKFGLDLNEYDSSELQIICRHMTTADEDGVHLFREYGILDLKRMLQQKTPLSLFLAKYKIRVYVDERRIEINGESYPILENTETCQECYYNRKSICKGYSRCNIFEKISYLASKLYFFGGTVECFIHATLKDMKQYSTVDVCPEILDTLDGVRSAVKGQISTTNFLCQEWMSKKRNCYVLEYPCRLSDMESFLPINYRNAYSEYENLLYLSGYDYSDYIEREIPKRIYDNILFLKKFIAIYFYDSKEYGSLLPGDCVPPEKLKIKQVIGDELVEMDI